MKKNIILGLLLLGSQWVFANGDDGTTNIMQSSGKIYVVLATVLATFIGILIFLIIIERKLSNLERQIIE